MDIERKVVLILDSHRRFEIRDELCRNRCIAERRDNCRQLLEYARSNLHLNFVLLNFSVLKRSEKGLMHTSPFDDDCKWHECEHESLREFLEIIAAREIPLGVFGTHPDVSIFIRGWLDQHPHAIHLSRFGSKQCDDSTTWFELLTLLSEAAAQKTAALGQRVNA